MKFRKRPLEVDAYQLTQAYLDKLFRDKPDATKIQVTPNVTAYRTWLTILTLEGLMTANVGDWIVKGIKGETYPCRADIFKLTYEPIT